MTSDAYKSMTKAFDKYLGVAGKKGLKQKVKDLSEHVPKTLSKELDISVKKVPDHSIDNAYKFIQREFEEGVEAIKENKKRNEKYQPSISFDDVAYKVNEGIKSSLDNGENDLMEKGKRSLFGKIQTNGEVQKKPTLDVYDNLRDGGFSYGTRYGVFEFDDKEPRA